MITASLANAAWFAANLPSFSAYQRALDDPAEAQHRLLMLYIRRNQNTAFGIAHGFADIRSPEDFAQRVPLSDYEDLEPWIDRIRSGEPNVLTAEPVTRLVPTSGSTRARKLIPYTKGFQREFDRAVGPWISDLYRSNPRLMFGRAYWSITPATQFAEDKQSKIPIGFAEDSEYLGGFRKRLVDRVMAVPGQVSQIQSIDEFRFVTLRHLLSCRDLRLISVWHPSFLSQLLEQLPAHWEKLLSDIANRLPERARELARLGPHDPARLWPNLGLISCWADGHSAGAAAALAAKFPGIHVQPKGLLATEGVVTIPFAGRQPLAIRSHFFEFIDSDGRCRFAGDLRYGQTYSVILTNAGGLWRYRLHDRVEVTGFLGKTACLKFIGKESQLSDRFGEKLSDAFVSDVLRSIFANHGTGPAFAMLAPDVDADGCRYTLYTESPIAANLAAMLDERLKQNPQYAYCRSLVQLQTPRVYRLRDGGFNAYSAEMVQRGMRLGDIKPVALSAVEGWSARLPGEYVLQG